MINWPCLIKSYNTEADDEYAETPQKRKRQGKDIGFRKFMGMCQNTFKCPDIFSWSLLLNNWNVSHWFWGVNYTPYILLFNSYMILWSLFQKEKDVVLLKMVVQNWKEKVIN